MDSFIVQILFVENKLGSTAKPLCLYVIMLLNQLCADVHAGHWDDVLIPVNVACRNVTVACRNEKMLWHDSFTTLSNIYVTSLANKIFTSLSYSHDMSRPLFLMAITCLPYGLDMSALWQ